MAQTSSSETGGWGFGILDFLDGAADLAIKVKDAKAVDVETSEANNVPDQADIQAGQARQSASDGLGGTFSKSLMGVPVTTILVGVGVVVGGAVALKLLRVI